MSYMVSEKHYSSSIRNITIRLLSGIFFNLRNLFVRFVCIWLICLYGNIPHWCFIASDGKKCLCLSQETSPNQLIINVKTVLQRGRVLNNGINIIS